MKNDISQRYLTAILDYDKNTGIFKWAISRGGLKRGSIAGRINIKCFYRQIKIDGSLYYAHRLAWLYVYGEWPNGYIDHINNKRDDNRISNLRVVDKAGNSQNQRRTHNGSKSKYLGVYYNKKNNKWIAQIATNGQQMYLGSYVNEDAAHNAYQEKKKELHICQ